MDENTDQSLPFAEGEKVSGEASACSTTTPGTGEVLTNLPELLSRMATDINDSYDRYLEEMATGEGMPEAPIRA
jgi:hypothetical protein